MKYHNLIFILVTLLLISCSSKVDRAKNKISLEQVDKEKLDPLAHFNLKKDTSKYFEEFTGFNIDFDNVQIPQNKKPDDNRIYFVQVGITDSFEEISNLKVNIQKLFPDQKVEINYEPPFYRINIGPFDSREKANEVFSILEKENYSSIKIRVDSAR